MISSTVSKRLISLAILSLMLSAINLAMQSRPTWDDPPELPGLMYSVGQKRYTSLGAHRPVMEDSDLGQDDGDDRNFDDAGVNGHEKATVAPPGKQREGSGPGGEGHDDGANDDETSSNQEEVAGASAPKRKSSGGVDVGSGYDEDHGDERLKVHKVSKVVSLASAKSSHSGGDDGDSVGDLDDKPLKLQERVETAPSTAKIDNSGGGGGDDVGDERPKQKKVQAVQSSKNSGSSCPDQSIFFQFHKAGSTFLTEAMLTTVFEGTVGRINLRPMLKPDRITPKDIWKLRKAYTLTVMGPRIPLTDPEHPFRQRTYVGVFRDPYATVVSGWKYHQKEDGEPWTMNMIGISPCQFAPFGPLRPLLKVLFPTSEDDELKQLLRDVKKQCKDIWSNVESGSNLVQAYGQLDPKEGVLVEAIRALFHDHDWAGQDLLMMGVMYDGMTQLPCSTVMFIEDYHGDRYDNVSECWLRAVGFNNEGIDLPLGGVKTDDGKTISLDEAIDLMRNHTNRRLNQSGGGRRLFEDKKKVSSASLVEFLKNDDSPVSKVLHCIAEIMKKPARHRCQ